MKIQNLFISQSFSLVGRKETSSGVILLPLIRIMVLALLTVGIETLVGCTGAGSSPDTSDVAAESTSSTVLLTAAEVQLIIAQAATKALELGLAATIAVMDHEGFVLGVLRMSGATTTTTITGGGTGGLEGATLAGSAALAAISKAGTGAYFGTQGNAFTTRTASFIVQEHFPPHVNPSPGGPLFGVQFSSLSCSDVARTGHFNPGAFILQNGIPKNGNLPLGLSADPGGLPLYKNGTAVGGIGVEGNGIYTLDTNPADNDQSLEELAAASGTKGFQAPSGIRGDQIFLDGIRLPFANAEPPSVLATRTYASFLATGGTEIVTPAAAPATGFQAFTLPNGVTGFIDQDTATYQPGLIASSDSGLTTSDVLTIVGQAAAQANATRAAIRLPLGSKARVSITVVDTTGLILGMFRTPDAPIFGWDVSAQKARTVAFLSKASAGGDLTTAGLGSYVTAAATDGIALGGAIAFSDTAVGFLSQPIFPPGAISPFSNGPFSLPLGTWSIFNTGLQLDLMTQGLLTGGVNNILTNLLGPGGVCSNVANLPNGITIFPGSFPLYKGGILVGGIGISGDGVDQDNIIGFAGSAGFEAPGGIRSDTIFVRGVRLPFSVFPRHPNL